MIFLTSPLFFLLFGITITGADVKNIVTIFVPYIIGQILTFKILCSDVRSLNWSHIYDTSMAPHISFSILKEILGFKIKFNVTPKDIDTTKGYFQFKSAAPHMVLLVLSLLALLNGVHKLNNGSIDIGSTAINSMWCLYNLYAIIASILVSYQKPTEQLNEDIKISEELMMNSVGELFTENMQPFYDVKINQKYVENKV